MHPMLNTAVRAARRAATVIQRASNNLDLITPEKKGHNDFVSEVDRAAEQAIIDTILEAYPNHAILAEESGSRGNSDYVWIIDPLDGTTNFLHGFPQYAISIALEYKGVITQAVVYDPNRNDLFTATRGVGAFLNDRRIRVSKVRELSDALVGTGFPYTRFENLETYLNIFRDMAQKAAGVRRPGAASLDLAYVACGRFDGFFEFDLKLHDIAAGTLIVQEAGGLVTDLNGEEKYLESGDVLCGTPRVFGQMLSLIRGHLK
ncbi:inositol monophosphatase [Chitinibacter sp. SCUT-21]|uniref:inositol monophosphatase family protein n=1 Tax=Chitinibacter sp. SCUT-21 TaxID=2970891 RepID=UPI0035A6A306